VFRYIAEVTDRQQFCGNNNKTTRDGNASLTPPISSSNP